MQALLAAAQVFQLALAGELVDLDADALVLGEDLVLDHGVEGAEEVALADEEVGLGAEGVEHAGHLDGDVAGADESRDLGLLLELEEAVAGDAEVGAGDALGDVRAAADGDERLLGLDGLDVAVVEADVHGVGVLEGGAPVDVLDVVVVEVALVDAVEALDVGVALVLEGGPVEGCGLADGEAVRGGFVYGLGHGGRVPCYLLGDAAWPC